MTYSQRMFLDSWRLQHYERGHTFNLTLCWFFMLAQNRIIFSLQYRRILCEQVLNMPSSVYKLPSWIRKTLEAWSECKRSERRREWSQEERQARGEEKRAKNTTPFPAFFHSSQLSTFCESKMVAKHLIEWDKPLVWSSTKKTACTASFLVNGLDHVSYRGPRPIHRSINRSIYQPILGCYSVNIHEWLQDCMIATLQWSFPCGNHRISGLYLTTKETKSDVLYRQSTD